MGLSRYAGQGRAGAGGRQAAEGMGRRRARPSPSAPLAEATALVLVRGPALPVAPRLALLIFSTRPLSSRCFATAAFPSFPVIFTALLADEKLTVPFMSTLVKARDCDVANIKRGELGLAMVVSGLGPDSGDESKIGEPSGSTRRHAALTHPFELSACAVAPFS